MKELTPDARGTFLVTTQGSTHLWEITDEGVFVTRNPDGRVSGNPYGLDSLNGRRLLAHVERWPEVGYTFKVWIGGDIPWTRSSIIRDITEVENG